MKFSSSNSWCELGLTCYKPLVSFSKGGNGFGWRCIISWSQKCFLVLRKHCGVGSSHTVNSSTEKTGWKSPIINCIPIWMLLPVPQEIVSNIWCKLSWYSGTELDGLDFGSKLNLRDIAVYKLDNILHFYKNLSYGHKRPNNWKLRVHNYSWKKYHWYVCSQF